MEGDRGYLGQERRAGTMEGRVRDNLGARPGTMEGEGSGLVVTTIWGQGQDYGQLTWKFLYG